MPAIVEFPTVVKGALEVFSHVFATKPARVHFAEYVTGLIIANHKNISSINREFAVTTDQSSLNRWLTEVNWNEEQLNEERLSWLQRDSSTCYSERGVIAIDNVLIDHSGKQIEDVGYFWDHAEKRNKIAHDYIISNYVCTSGKHYSLEFRRFIKRDQCEERGIAFHNHNEFVRELVDWVVEHNIPGAFTFDSYFTNAGNLNHINAYKRAYVGDLKFNRNIVVRGETLSAAEFASQIKSEDRKSMKVGDTQQWYFTKSIRIPKVNHRVRIIVIWGKQNDSIPKKILITNRTYWDATRILRVYRARWRGTECFHRDGKQHLGMGDCQVRSGLGQTRHLYLVFLTHSILMHQLKQSRAREWALERLTTIGQACRAVVRQTLSDTISWVIERIEEEGWNSKRIKVQLALP
jgi:hypothetical protein